MACFFLFVKWLDKPNSNAKKNPETKESTKVSGFGAEGEIRTLEELMTPTRFPIVRARPTTRLLHIALK